MCRKTMTNKVSDVFTPLVYSLSYAYTMSLIRSPADEEENRVMASQRLVDQTELAQVSLDTDPEFSQPRVVDMEHYHIPLDIQVRAIDNKVNRLADSVINAIKRIKKLRRENRRLVMVIIGIALLLVLFSVFVTLWTYFSFRTFLDNSDTSTQEQSSVNSTNLCEGCAPGTVFYAYPSLF